MTLIEFDGSAKQRTEFEDIEKLKEYIISKYDNVDFDDYEEFPKSMELVHSEYLEYLGYDEYDSCSYGYWIEE